MTGLTLSLTRSPKQYFRIVKTAARGWRELKRHELYRAVKEFHHERLVDYREGNDGSISVVLTDDGQRVALNLNLENMAIKAPKRWDGKWRLVIYDIPDRKKAAREEFRHQLKELGLHEWQESVFVHPFPCENEINLLVEFLEIRSYVRSAEMSRPTNEAELKIKFGLV